MTIDDLFALLIMAAAGVAFFLGSIVRMLRRMAEARPAAGVPSREPRTVPRAPPARAAEPQAPRPLHPRRTTKGLERKRAPSLESRLFGNRRLSAGARLIVASEILSPPKALRRRR